MDFSKYDKEKILVLQITRDCFYAILNGTQTVETRRVYPSNYKRYISDSTEIVNDEWVYPETDVREYDYLYLINGRRADAPRLLFEVKEVVLCTDVDELTGEVLTYEEKGKTWGCVWLEYHLGKVVNTENC